MLKETFGLAEAQELEVKHKKIDWPTAGAVLSVLGVANKVKEEAEAKAAALGKKIGEVKAEIVGIVDRDAKDAKDTAAQIAKAKTDRQKRALENIRDINSKRSDLEEKQQSVRGLARLAKKYGG